MQYHLFNDNQEARNLIIFLNGWGMGLASVQHIAAPPQTHLLIGYDYRHLLPPPIDLSLYENITIIAWSMGVWAAEQMAYEQLIPNNINAIALAGSPYIRSNLFAIPNTVFDITLNSLNENTREVFNRRMCGGKSLKALHDDIKARATDELRDELLIAKQIDEKRGDTLYKPLLNWIKAIIAEKDKIIPAANLIRYWSAHNVPTYTLSNKQHYFLADTTNWQQIIDFA